MIQLPDIQKIWLKTNFGLDKRDMPVEFWESSDIIDMLICEHYFRGKEYMGDCNNFSEMCFESLTANEKENKKRFNKLFIQISYLKEECYKKEYYELLSNINEMIDEFVRFINMYDESIADESIRDLLKSLKGVHLTNS